MKKSEIQENLKRIRDSRRELEVIKARFDTYQQMYGDSNLTKSLNKELKEKKCKIQAEIAEAEGIINRLPNVSERCTLSLYYIDCLSMAEVADKLFYSERSVWGKHKSALTNLSKFDDISFS